MLNYCPVATSNTVNAISKRTYIAYFTNLRDQLHASNLRDQLRIEGKLEGPIL